MKKLTFKITHSNLLAIKKLIKSNTTTKNGLELKPSVSAIINAMLSRGIQEVNRREAEQKQALEDTTTPKPQEEQINYELVRKWLEFVDTDTNSLISLDYELAAKIRQAKEILKNEPKKPRILKQK